MGIKKTLDSKLEMAAYILPPAAAQQTANITFYVSLVPKKHVTWQTNKQTNNTYLHFQTQTVRLSCVIDLTNDGAETQD